MIFIDTGPFITNSVTTDPDYQKIHSLFESYLHEGFVTTSDVISETINWFTRKITINVTVEAGKILIEGELAKIININYEDRLEALGILKKYSDQNLSFTDATSFAVIKRLDIKKVFSLDKHFKLLRGIENIFN